MSRQKTFHLLSGCMAILSGFSTKAGSTWAWKTAIHADRLPVTRNSTGATSLPSSENPPLSADFLTSSASVSLYSWTRSASLSQPPSLAAALIQPCDLSCSIAYVSRYKSDCADTDPLHEDQRFFRRLNKLAARPFWRPEPPDSQYQMRLHAETVFAYTPQLTSVAKMYVC